MSVHNIVAYVSAIRNPSKRKYATKYLHHLQDCYDRKKGVPAPSYDGLTYMGAQAVRHNLTAMMRDLLGELPDPADCAAHGGMTP